MSLRIVPASAAAQTFTATSTSTSAPSVPGLHDTLRTGLGPSPLSSASNALAADPATTLTSAHPLEARLKNWEATQEALRMETLRRAYGAAEPIRRQMELGITRRGAWRPVALGGGQVGHHEQILRGKDASISWEDVYPGDEGMGSAGGVGMHDEMERKLKM
ncbi:hypothetical protein ACHAQF_008425 [Verticillium nonalfalfae]